MVKRRIRPVDPSQVPSTPTPPMLKVKIKRVFLGPKHVREMQPAPCEFPQPIHWTWEKWIDASGKEYASVKHECT
jgi:hypothetical protein